KRLSPLTRGLMNLPGWLDSLLPRQSTGLSVALVILVLLLSIPFIVTPIAVWQQGVIAVGSVALGWALIAAIVLPAGYFAYTVLAPRLHVLVSPEREARLGDFVYEAVADEWTQLEAPLFSDFVARVVGELRAPESPYDIRISLVDQEDLNAMALPGGRIVVFSGLVKASPSPDALAGVLAHELSHVERRHSLKHIMRSIGLIQFAGAAVGGGIDGFELAETFVEASSGLLILRHSRLAETDADTVAVGKLRRAGRSAEGLIEFFDLIQEKYGDLPGTLGWLSTHPMTAQRVDRIKQLLEARPTENADAVQPSMSTKPWMSAEDWKLLQLEID
ncbi:MAG: M48 family metallopeptidase, partial [Planctomycetota bacterium]